MDILAATFPVSTLSNTPKVRALEIIKEQDEAKCPETQNKIRHKQFCMLHK